MDKSGVIEIKTNETIQLDYLTIQKMVFLFNSLEEGWTIRKNKKTYIFTKPHNKSKEVMLDTYLSKFLEKNFNINNIIN